MVGVDGVRMSDDNEQHAVVCRPTENFAPVAGSVRVYCNLCATEVWLSPATRELAGDSALILCIDCAPGVIETAAEVELLTPTAEQLAELRRWELGG